MYYILTTSSASSVAQRDEDLILTQRIWDQSAIQVQDKPAKQNVGELLLPGVRKGYSTHCTSIARAYYGHYIRYVLHIALVDLCGCHRHCIMYTLGHLRAKINK